MRKSGISVAILMLCFFVGTRGLTDLLEIKDAVATHMSDPSKQGIGLKCLGPSMEGSRWCVDRRSRIGRMDNYEITLDHASVSRHHAEVRLTSQGWTVRDLGSTNGTYLNGVRLGLAEEHLRKGDVIQVGEVALMVENSTAPKKLDSDPELTIVDSLQDTEEHDSSLDNYPVPAPIPLATLVQIGRDFRRFETMASFLNAMLWQVAEFLDIAFGAFVLRDGRTGVLAVPSTFEVEGDANRDDNQYLGWARWTLSQQGTLLCQRQALASPGQMQSIILARLRTPYRELGVLVLGRGPQQPAFGMKDLQSAQALTVSLSPSIDSLDCLLNKQHEIIISVLTALTHIVQMREGSASEQTTDYALLIADEMKLDELSKYHLQIGTSLRDLGLIGMPDSLLRKPHAFTPAESTRMREHVYRGVALLESISPLAPLISIVRSHHEHWDGNGYPDRLAGEQIPLLGRIVAVADALNALLSERPYRDKFSLNEAMNLIRSRSGSQFDPQCVLALQRAIPRIKDLTEQRGATCSTLSLDALRKTTEALILSPDLASVTMSSQE